MEGIPGSPASGSALVERAKAILLKPAEEWPKIEAEPATTGEIFKTYVVPLAAIGPVCGFIGGQVFGYGAFGFSYRPGLMSGLGMAVVSYVMALVGLFVLMLIANFLAPKFGGNEDQTRAFKLVAYSMTAAWVAGVFGLIPALGFLSLAGLYSIYLFYVGASALMKVPKDKAGSYTAVTFVAAIILYFVVAGVTGAIAGTFGMNPLAKGPFASDGEVSGSLDVPGVGPIDVGKIEQAAKRMEDQANGKARPVDTAALQGLLPASIGSYQRTALESAAMGGMGNVEATYENGDSRFDLKITDTNAMGALAGMGVAMGMEQSREDADGYERTGVVDGQMQTEKWNKSDGRGSYGTMVGDRFMVEAEGSVPGIDVLKAAVASVNKSSLATLAD